MSKNNGSWITDCLYLFLAAAFSTSLIGAFLYLLCRPQIGDLFELTEPQKTDRILSVEGRTNDREVLPEGTFSVSKVERGILERVSYIFIGKPKDGKKNRVRLLVVTSEKVETMLLEADEDGIVRLELPAGFKRLEIQ